MIDTNTAEVMGKMRARSVSVVRELEQAARRMAPIIERDSKRVMQEKIYDIPEKRSKSGRALWIRTGRLLQAEHAEARRVDVELSNTMQYAGARYHLGDLEKPTKAASGIPRQVRPPQMSVQWQREAMIMDRAYILETRRRAVLRGLRNP